LRKDLATSVTCLSFQVEEGEPLAPSHLGRLKNTSWLILEHVMNTWESRKSTTVRVGHQTTVEASRVASTTVSKHGQKRTIDHLLAGSESPDHRVLSDIANRPQETDSVRPNGFGSCKRLEASRINDLASFPSASNVLSVYSQRRAIAATPTPATNPLLSLSHPSYDLPERLVENFSSLGVNCIYPWQSKCLLADKLISGEGNLVYTAPTGGGKSLVADVLMLKKVIKHPGKKGLLVLPYVALVQVRIT